MADALAENSAQKTVSKAKKEKKPSFFKRIFVFIQQIIAELKKVVSPTRKELLSYTSVVLVFVAIMMAIVWVMDRGFSALVLWVFGIPE